ncbi:acetate--CoA ligase [Novosphingobium mangrovi (ex Huang et al. 2023)]|uniref:acetate--CoA ligase n=1 Tax=Novosphingobium mangrovi (ex Huang et al. 2023) TaxID=2976432 RepID=A0ABT2I0J1_9SPHN|nr:acetate--CoA ligase [Novosphingobium mangrovi (ex Huang et al. 2023)]MCT2398326.1 acetate--CoA ligase [Novosphingobium mangrovi (ex Huang et al. 2023)]
MSEEALSDSRPSVYPPIRKDREALRPRPNLFDYESECAAFSWDKARALLDGLPDGQGLNIAYEAVDRHASGAKGDKAALRWLGKAGERRDITYRELSEETSRFANALKCLGVEPGERVYVMMGRLPELYIAMLGALKAGCVASPLFSAFGPEPIAVRMQLGDGRVLVTTPRLYKRKVAGIRDQVPGLAHVLLVGEGEVEGDGLHRWDRTVEAASPQFTIRPTDPEDMALLHFTSGTTGRPKGAIHVHQAVVAHHVTGRYALDLHEDDVFWCTADPGWVTGTSYGIIAPLTNGVTSIVAEAEFDAETWFDILEQEKVSVWYTAPTAIRMMMRIGTDVAKGRDLSALRFMASVGEPLNPEAVVWGQEAFGMPFHDNWWQTETGGIMIANYAALDIRPGSMGRPMPGIEAAIVRKLDSGDVEVIDEPMVEGELALRRGWPSMMRGYLHEEERYRKSFAGDWYLTGDLAQRDSDGYFWFVGRADDVIKSAGHLIGPFEVESALIEHPAVAEAAVIGKPDPTLGEMVKAFVTLRPGHEASEAMRRELIGHARKKLGAAVAPKEIDFRENLPKTRSGKIMRRLLKARELGLPEGDISTLESDEK